MKYSFIRFFGLKGSFKWACKMMAKGKTVRPASASGSVTYRLDDESQGRITWAFAHNPVPQNYKSANMFLSDFNATDWVVV